MDVLLTGATGFIGSNLRTALACHNRVFALTRHADLAGEESLIWLQADLAQPEAPLFLPDRMDAIVYLAQSRAYRDFPEQAWDMFNVNVRSVLALLDYARRSNVRIFILASTANVYKQSHECITEEFVVEPLSFYARSKRMAEMLVESYAEFFKCFVLRLFTVYGPTQAGTLIPSLIDRVRRRQPIQVQGQYGFKLSPIYISDINKVIQAVLEEENVSPGFEILNIGGEEKLSIYELGLAIGRILEISPRFELIGGAEPGGWMADNSKLKKMFRLNPFISLQEGLRYMIDGHSI